MSFSYSMWWGANHGFGQEFGKSPVPTEEEQKEIDEYVKKLDDALKEAISKEF